jgi:hypothetical protein
MQTALEVHGYSYIIEGIRKNNDIDENIIGQNSRYTSSNN